MLVCIPNIICGEGDVENIKQQERHLNLKYFPVLFLA